MMPQMLPIPLLRLKGTKLHHITIARTENG
jgi:hypothetical protein